MELGKIEDCIMLSLFSVSSGVVVEQDGESVPCVGPSSSSSVIVLLAELKDGIE